MLLLLFDLDSDRYAIDSRQVVEVLPLVRLKRIPLAERGVAGVLNYRGAPVPVIDLTSLLLGRPSRPSLSTRIIVVNYPAGPERSGLPQAVGGETRRLGLIAEHATETVRRAPSDFSSAGVRADGAPYLGAVATDSRGVVQLVDVSALLPPAVRDLLFTQAAES